MDEFGQATDEQRDSGRFTALKFFHFQNDADRTSLSFNHLRPVLFASRREFQRCFGRFSNISSFFSSPSMFGLFLWRGLVRLFLAIEATQ